MPHSISPQVPYKAYTQMQTNTFVLPIAYSLLPIELSLLPIEPSRQRYAPTALCLPSVMPCRDWRVFAQNRSFDGFYNSFVFYQHTGEEIENWGPPPPTNKKREKNKQNKTIVIYL